MLHKWSPGSFSKACNDVYDSRGKPDLAKPFRKFECRQGRLLGGFQHARASGRKCGRQLPRSHQQRIVPGDDLSGDADRFFQGEADRVVRDWIYESEDLRRETAVVLEASRGVVDV